MDGSSHSLGSFFVLRLLPQLQTTSLCSRISLPPSSSFPSHLYNRNPKDCAITMAPSGFKDMMVSFIFILAMACTPFILRMLYKLDQDIKFLGTEFTKLADEIREEGLPALLWYGLRNN